MKQYSVPEGSHKYDNIKEFLYIHGMVSRAVKNYKQVQLNI